MKLVFLGAPGAGKGTQAELLSEQKSIAHISTGDMLRRAVAAGTELGQTVKTIMESGQLVPDEVMIELIQDRTSQEDCSTGYILDGFPRTVPQAQALKAMLAERNESLSNVVYFEVSMEALEARLSARREAQGRKDDSAETQLERLRVYQEQTAPLIDFYDSEGVLARVESNGTIEEVNAALMQALSA